VGIYDFGFGKLNAVEKPSVGRPYDGNSFFSTLRKAAEKVFQYNAFENQGVIYAICLRVEPTKTPPPDSWVANVFGADAEAGSDTVPGETTTNLRTGASTQSSPKTENKYWLSIKARIPELHAHIPDPTSNEAKGKVNFYINMHPTFMSAEPVGASIEIPAPGDIIKVDFQDRTNFSQPLYLGRVAQGTLINTDDNPAKQIFVNIRDGGELRTDGGLSGAGIPNNSNVSNGQISPPEECQPIGDDFAYAKVNGNWQCIGKISLSSIGNGQSLRSDAASKFFAMAGNCPETITPSTAFRSMAKQTQLFQRLGPGTAAPPGKSNHQSGIAVDIKELSNPNNVNYEAVYSWMSQNAEKYNFYRTVFTRPRNEPWHWEYIDDADERASQRPEFVKKAKDPNFRYSR
jgi:hypothetical protein